MADGFRVWDAAGTLVFDSLEAAGGAAVGGLISGGAGTISFPQFPGRTMHAMVVDGGEWFENAGSGVTFTYNLGYPVATVQTWAPTCVLAVF